MAFCSNCGTQTEDSAQFCPSCGQQAAPPPPPQGYQQPPQQPPPPQGYQQPGYQQYGQPLSDEEANKGMAILAYIIFFVPLIAGTYKTSPFVKFHTNQGINLAITAAAYSIMQWIITAILAATLIIGGMWGIYAVITTILGLAWLGVVAFMIVGIVNAAQGQMKPLPAIGTLFTILK